MKFAAATARSTSLVLLAFLLSANFQKHAVAFAADSECSRQKAIDVVKKVANQNPPDGDRQRRDLMLDYGLLAMTFGDCAESVLSDKHQGEWIYFEAYLSAHAEYDDLAGNSYSGVSGQWEEIRLMRIFSIIYGDPLVPPAAKADAKSRFENVCESTDTEDTAAEAHKLCETSLRKQARLYAHP